MGHELNESFVLALLAHLQGFCGVLLSMKSVLRDESLIKEGVIDLNQQADLGQDVLLDQSLQLTLNFVAQRLLHGRDLTRDDTQSEDQKLEQVLVQAVHEIVLGWTTLDLLGGQFVLFVASPTRSDLIQDSLGLINH